MKHLWIVCSIIGIALYLGWPLVVHPTTITSASGEEYLLSYIISWGRHALTTDFWQLFSIPFMYPSPDTLAFSDYFIAQAVLSIPLYWLTGSAIGSYNLLVVLALILNPLSMYLLAYRITKNSHASLVAAVLLGFSIGRIDTIAYLQLFALYWTLLSLSSAILFLQTKQVRYAVLAGLFMLAQGLDTVFMTLLLCAALALLLLAYIWRTKTRISVIVPLLVSCSVAAGLIAVAYIPYLRVSDTYNYTRTISDAFGGSAFWADYLYPSGNSTLKPLAQRIIAKEPWTGYLGLPLSILVLCSLTYIALSARKLLQSWKGLTAVLLFFTGIILSLGPYLQLMRHKHLFDIPIPLPYLALYHLIPGFKSVRVPQRWSHLAILGGCILVAVTLKLLFPRIKNAAVRFVLLLAIIAAVIFEVKQPLFTRSVPATREIYQLLAEKEPGTILELPATTYPYPLSQLEVVRLYHHAEHFPYQHHYINGYSGFAAPEWSQKILSLQRSAQDFRTTITTFSPTYVFLTPEDWSALSREIESEFTATEAAQVLTELGYKQTVENSETLFFEK